MFGPFLHFVSISWSNHFADCKRVAHLNKSNGLLLSASSPPSSHQQGAGEANVCLSPPLFSPAGAGEVNVCLSPPFVSLEEVGGGNVCLSPSLVSPAWVRQNECLPLTSPCLTSRGPEEVGMPPRTPRSRRKRWPSSRR